MKISVNPTYLCNFRCVFCYLTNEQLSDKNKLDLEVYEQRLKEVTDNEPIEYIDLYGGEIALLSEEYVDQLFEITHKYYQGPVNIITNFSKDHPVFYRDDVQVSVSFDFTCRERWEYVFGRMCLFSKPIHVLMLASECLIKEPVDDMIVVFNNMNNIKSVEIKPYSTNQANDQSLSFKDFEMFVQKWIDHPNKDFEFINEKNIQDCLDKKYNTFSDDHVYITPTGKFGVLEFDALDREYFLELNTFDEYIEWANWEKKVISENSYCNRCEYLGHCLSEHLRNVTNLDNSCNGFKHLLDWYAERSQT